MASAIDFVLHLDKYISELINYFGVFSYLILFLVIFIETGLVIMPFLPGDTLLFIVGSFSAQGVFNIFLIGIILVIAAITGDSLNYFIGNYFGERVFEKNAFFNRKYLEKTKKFYEKHGGKTIFFARFIPIIRSFAPFVAGVGKMPYRRFFLFNVIGGLVWVCFFLSFGYFFGSLPIIKDNFGIFIGIIIVASAIPVIIEIIRQRKQ